MLTQYQQVPVQSMIPAHPEAVIEPPQNSIERSLRTVAALGQTMNRPAEKG